MGYQHAARDPDVAKRFFREVTKALEGAEEIVIVGPSTAKLQLIESVSKNAPLLEPKLVGVETVNHPTDGHLATYAKEYFEAHDRTHQPAP